MITHFSHLGSSGKMMPHAFPDFEDINLRECGSDDSWLGRNPLKCRSCPSGQR